ncbi:MAG: uracil-DNA glycosylase [Bacteroidota bacterium]
MHKDIFDKIIVFFEGIRQQTGEYIYFEEMPKQFEAVTVQPTTKTENQASKKPQESIIKTEEKKTEEIKQSIQVSIEPTLLDEKVLPDWDRAKSLDELYNKIKDCQKCPLGMTRTKFVFGEGNPNADIMVIGEAPGADEDMQGRPFVGRAGQLLTKILESVGFERKDVFIGNINKCRPPGNRVPAKNEVEACEPFLLKQIELIRPKFILALGLTAANTLLKSNYKMGDIRGKLFDYNGIQTLVTYHPAALLRNPNWKKPVWEDMKLLRKLYDESIEKSKKE